VAGPPFERGAADITLFKSLGVGLADVALGVELLRGARRSDEPLNVTYQPRRKASV
jgi:ornithine cyclodeaminase/alanine dehydrogenase-like protein (mu-crystallin family)